MNVYSFVADSDQYQNLSLVNEAEDWEALYQFYGCPIGAAWRPLNVEILCDDESSDERLPSDTPSLFAGVPTLSRRAAEVLQPMLHDNGELLPLQCDEGDYFIFNVTRIVDALNEANSDVVRFPDGKRILDIRQFVFFPSQLKDVDIFKLPQQMSGGVFVTDGFVRAVREAGLRGFSFDWLWASEQSSSSSVLYSNKL